MNSSLVMPPNDSTCNQSSTDSIKKESNLNKKIPNSYEKEIEYLETQLMQINKYSSDLSYKKYNCNLSCSQWYLTDKIVNDDEVRQAFIHRLEQEHLHINSLVLEANRMSKQMQQQTDYHVISHTSVSYLKPTERTIDNLCEPAIQVNRIGSSPQIWNRDKFESQFTDMKTTYDQWKLTENQTNFLKRQLERYNPFYDEQSSRLIGVANIYLRPLFCYSKLDYIVPIVNTKGEVM